MSDKKNIDRLFQEKLKNFEATPSDAVWENIHNTLHEKKKKRRVIPIWWQIGGVAAALLLILTISGVFNSDKITETDNINTVVDNTDNNPNTVVSNSSENNINENEDVSSNNNTNDDASQNNSNELINDLNKSSSRNTKSSYATNDETTNTTNSESKIKKYNININENSVKESIASNSETIKENNDDASQNNSSLIKEKSNLNKLLKSNKKDSNIAATELEKNNNSQTSDKSNNTINSNILNEQSNTKDDALKNALENAIAEANDEQQNEKEKELKNRWSVAPNVAPVYFNTLGNGSSIHNQFNDNIKSGDVNMSYGITGGYAINDKLKVRAGVNKVNLGYSTNDVIFYNNNEAIASFDLNTSENNSSQIQNINFRNETANSSFLSAPSISLDNAPEIVKENSLASLDQQFGFIEVPVELEYKVLDKRLDINIIGGFSTMFLSNNDIYVVSNSGERTLIGEANNINDMSYSANLGIGLNYGLSDKFNINLEPMFKYQINTFSNTTGDFQPYFIGVYTGLSFKF